METEFLLNDYFGEDIPSRFLPSGMKATNIILDLKPAA